MLSIRTGLQKLSKTNVYDLHHIKIDPFYISKPWIRIANSELSFEEYMIALKQEKYDIEVRDYGTIKHNQIIFDFMQRMFNLLDRLYIIENCILINTMEKYQLRKQSLAEVKILSRKKRKQIKWGYIQAFTKKGCFVNKTNQTSLATSNTNNSNVNTDIPQWI